MTTVVAGSDRRALVVKERTLSNIIIRPRINKVRVDTSMGDWTLVIKPWWADGLDMDQHAVLTLSGANLQSIVDPDDAGLTALQATFTEASSAIPPGRYRYRLDRVTGSGPTRWGPFPFYIQDI